jgi:membrane-associated phospholipid phosphatase
MAGNVLPVKYVFKNEKAFEVGKIGLESFLLTGVTVQLFKNLCGRERPSAATRNGGFWHGPFSYIREPKGGKGISSFDSFPSGHTTTVFAAATTISDFYTEPWVSYTCYSLATVVAVSRVTESTHWLSDCFVGAIFGYYGTKLVERLNYGSGGIALLPYADEDQYGLFLSVKF